MVIHILLTTSRIQTGRPKLKNCISQGYLDVRKYAYMAKMTLSFDQKIILEVAHCTAVARLPQRLKLTVF